MLGTALSGVPAGTLPQVPPTPSAHDWHAGQLDKPQHVRSTQAPLAHVPAFTQGCPTPLLQETPPSHALVPMHGVVATGSCWLTGTLPQTPSIPLPFFAAVQA